MLITKNVEDMFKVLSENAPDIFFKNKGYSICLMYDQLNNIYSLYFIPKTIGLKGFQIDFNAYGEDKKIDIFWIGEKAPIYLLHTNKEYSALECPDDLKVFFIQLFDELYGETVELLKLKGVNLLFAEGEGRNNS